MPKATKAGASQVLTVEGFRGAYEELAGGYTVGFEEFSPTGALGETFAVVGANMAAAGAAS